MDAIEYYKRKIRQINQEGGFVNEVKIRLVGNKNKDTNEDKSLRWMFNNYDSERYCFVNCYDITSNTAWDIPVHNIIVELIDVKREHSVIEDSKTQSVEVNKDKTESSTEKFKKKSSKKETK